MNKEEFLKQQDEVDKSMTNMGFTIHRNPVDILDIVMESPEPDFMVKGLKNENTIFLFNIKKTLYLLIKFSDTMSLIGHEEAHMMITVILKSPDDILPMAQKMKMIQSIMGGEDVKDHETIEFDRDNKDNKDNNHDRGQED